MSFGSPTTPDTHSLHTAIRRQYARLAEDPASGRAGRHGHALARRLGYDPALLARLPGDAVARIAGVGNPLRDARIEHGETVLDLGCGAGVDLLAAARRVGSAGRAIGVDLTPEMCAVAEAQAKAAGLDAQVEVRLGDGARVPVATSSVDVVVVNAVLNAVPDKAAFLAEIRRVLRAGGRLYLADVFLTTPLAPEHRRDVADWTHTLGGVPVWSTCRELMAALGFGVRVQATRPHRKGSPTQLALGQQYGAQVRVVEAWL